MSKILKNGSGSTVVINDTGVTILNATQYTIPPQDYLLWSASSNVVTYVGNGALVVNDGSFDLSISDGIDLIKGIFPTELVADPTVVNEDATLANNEYSYVFPAGVRRYEVSTRNSSKLQYSYESGQTAITYATIYPGKELTANNIKPGTPITLYYRVSKPSETLEIVYWV